MNCSIIYIHDLTFARNIDDIYGFYDQFDIKIPSSNKTLVKRWIFSITYNPISRKL